MMKKIISFVLVLVILLSPSVVLSQGLVPCDDPGSCGFSAFAQLLSNVFTFIIRLGITLSSIAFAWAGFLYITAQGDQSKIKRATSIFTNFAIGLFLLLSSVLIITLILDSLGVKGIFRNGII